MIAVAIWVQPSASMATEGQDADVCQRVRRCGTCSVSLSRAEAAKKHDNIFPAVQPVHLHRHTRAARARKSANMASANMVSVLPRKRLLRVAAVQGHGVRRPRAGRGLHRIQCNSV